MIGTIIGRYKQIIACLADDPDDLEPIFWEGPEGEVVASDWAGGFLDAVALRLKAWEPLINDSQAGVMMIPIFLLSEDANSMSDPMRQPIGSSSWWRSRTSSRVRGWQAFWKDRQHEHWLASTNRRRSSRQHRGRCAGRGAIGGCPSHRSCAAGSGSTPASVDSDPEDQ